MAKKPSNMKKTFIALGLSAVALASAFTLAGCSESKLTKAQNNIDHQVTSVLNQEEIQNELNSPFSNFTFLGANVEESNSKKYNVNINGIATYQNTNQKAYTAFNYIVNKNYFDEKSTKSNADIINTLAEIVKNEDYETYSIANVNNLQALNHAMGKATESPIDDFQFNRNFLYGVSDVNFSEEDGVVSFSTKEYVNFSRTRTVVEYAYVWHGDNDWSFEPRWTVVTDYEPFFMDHNVYLKLTPEEMKQAKTDSSIIFDKFTEYVNGNQKDKYVIQQTSVAKEKDMGANMHSDISLERM